jgi:dienelactone hydrolase
MIKKITCAFFLLIVISAFGQNLTPEKFGFKHIVYKYKNDSVDILIFSKKGEEDFKKPLFFFCQGSLPKPLIIYDEQGGYGTFPFMPNNLSERYHLIIVSKPYIPVMVDKNALQQPYMTYVDSSGSCLKEYSDRYLISYYVQRNIEIIKYLQKQKWVSSEQLVVAGHSEGSSVAAQMAAESKIITHLIYSGGNPFGRIMNIIAEDRARETDTDSTRYGESSMSYWGKVVKNKNCMDSSHGDTDKTTFDFSFPPPIKHLGKLKIPVLVTFGTKDAGAPFNDYLQVETIRQGKRNFTFRAYIGTEHNFFPLIEDGKPDYSILNCDKVFDDWLDWLNSDIGK